MVISVRRALVVILLLWPTGPTLLLSAEPTLELVQVPAGRLHQGVAGAAQSVVFMAAGQPLQLKTA